MKHWIEIWHTKKNGKDNYIKLVQVKRLLVILNKSYNFSKVKVIFPLI